MSPQNSDFSLVGDHRSSAEDLRLHGIFGHDGHDAPGLDPASGAGIHDMAAIPGTVTGSGKRLVHQVHVLEHGTRKGVRHPDPPTVSERMMAHAQDRTAAKIDICRPDTGLIKTFLAITEEPTLGETAEIQSAAIQAETPVGSELQTLAATAAGDIEQSSRPDPEILTDPDQGKQFRTGTDRSGI